MFFQRFIKLTTDVRPKIAYICLFQAALGPVALDRARDLNLSEDIVEHAETLLVLAVLSVLITAPLFDFLIIFLGPRLLDKEESIIEENKSDSIITQIPTAMDFFV